MKRRRATAGPAIVLEQLSLTQKLDFVTGPSFRRRTFATYREYVDVYRAVRDEFLARRAAKFGAALATQVQPFAEVLHQAATPRADVEALGARLYAEKFGLPCEVIH